MRIGIRRRLLLIFLPLITVMLVATGIIINSFAEKQLEENFITSSEKLILQIDHAFSLFFDQVAMNARYLATHPLILQADNTITTYFKNEKPVKMTPSQNGGIEQRIWERFRHFAATHPGFQYVYMATENKGYIQWPEGKTMKFYNPTKRPFYLAALKGNNKVVRTSAYYWAPDNSACMSTVITITNKQGKRIGVMGLDVALKSLTAMVNKMQIGKNGFIVLIDKKGRILAHPKAPKLVFKDFKKMEIPALADEITKQKTAFRSKWNGTDYYLSMLTSPKINWKFIAFIPVNEFSQQLAGLRTVLLLAIIISFAVTVLLTWVAAGRISLPLQKVISGLTDSTNQIAMAADQIATSSQSLASTASEQASAEQNSSESLQRITDLSQQTTDMTGNNVKLMQENRSLTENSRSSLETVTGQMNRVEADSSQIGDIIKMIDEIAFQTNLLALNAAIEAARAGEAGSGFAVVADEVRSLAMKTADSARQTQQLLDGIIKRISETAVHVNGLNSDFNSIAESIQKTLEQTKAISQASREQFSRIEQISESSRTLEEVTGNVASSSEESAAAAEQLSAQTEQMKHLVTVVHRVVFGK